eukprot:1159318-Pelagomonas_calceolata.AAC.4
MTEKLVTFNAFGMTLIPTCGKGCNSTFSSMTKLFCPYLHIDKRLPRLRPFHALIPDPLHHASPPSVFHALESKGAMPKLGGKGGLCSKCTAWERLTLVLTGGHLCFRNL